MYWLELYIKNLSQNWKKTYIQKIHQENNQKKKNQIIFGGMGTKVETAGTTSCDFSP